MGYRMYFLIDGHGDQTGDAFWLRSWIATATSPNLRNWTDATLIHFPDWPWHTSVDLRFLAPLPKVLPDGSVELYFSTAQASSRTERSIISLRSTNGVEFNTTNRAAGLQPNVFYENSQMEGEMRAWRDPHIVQTDADNRWAYFAAQIPRRKAMLATLTLCGTTGRDCESGWFRGVIGVAHSLKSGPWRVLEPAAYLTEVTYIERDPMSIVATNQTAFWEMERPQVVHHGGKYHMFFHCWHAMVNPEWAANAFNTTEWPHPDGHDSTWYHLVATRPQGPFLPSVRGRPPVVRGMWSTGLYGAHLFNLSEAETHGKSSVAIAGWYISEHDLEALIPVLNLTLL